MKCCILSLAMAGFTVVCCGEEVDEAAAGLKERGAKVHFERPRVSRVKFVEQRLTEQDVQRLIALDAEGPFAITLQGDDFSDGDAAMLSRVEGLRHLTLLQTRVTRAAIDRLHQKLPEIRIVRTNGPYLGVALNKEAKVLRVLPKTEAAKAGIKEGDTIAMFAGQQISRTHDVLKLVSRSKPGDVVEVSLSRGDQSRTVKLTIGKLVLP